MTERQIKRRWNEINKLTDEGINIFSKPAAEDSSSSLADLEIWDVFALVKKNNILSCCVRGETICFCLALRVAVNAVL